MGKILLIEDDGELAETVSSKLDNNKHSFTYAYNDVSAIGAWGKAERDKKPFDCIILDLSIPSDVADIKLKKDYHGIYGILLLNTFCKDKNPEEQKEIWAKTVIYSGYIDNLTEKEIMKAPPCLPTRIRKQDANSISKLIEAVEKIVNPKKR